MANFGYKVDHSKINPMHECCYSCMQNCKCGNSICGQFWGPQLSNDCDMPQLISQQSKVSPSKLTRNVTEDDKRLLKKKLVNLQQDMLKEVQLEKMVTCPNIVLEFNMFHINQDVVKSVEIWRHKYAIDILKILMEIFGDTNIELPTEQLPEIELDETDFSEWDIIRDDSTLVDFINSQDLENIDSTMDSQHYFSSTADSNSLLTPNTTGHAE